MKTEQIIVNKIVADDGMILTDGEAYGKVIFLGADRNPDEFYEITEDEYKKTVEIEEAL